MIKRFFLYLIHRIFLKNEKSLPTDVRLASHSTNLRAKT